MKAWDPSCDHGAGAGICINSTSLSRNDVAAPANNTQITVNHVSVLGRSSDETRAAKYKNNIQDENRGKWEIVLFMWVNEILYIYLKTLPCKNWGSNNTSNSSL